QAADLERRQGRRRRRRRGRLEDGPRRHRPRAEEMKRRTWLGVLIGVAVAVAIVAGVFIDLKRKAAAILEKHERATLAKIEEFRSRSWPRVVMIGEALKGNRWDDLTKALDAFDGIPKVDLDELPGFQDSDPDAKGDPERIDAVLAKHQSCVDQLRAACRRNDLRPPYAYEDAYSMDLPYVTKAIQACRYLGVVAGRLHELGRDREAADAALLALSVAQDMDCGGPAVNHLVGIVCEQHGTRALRKVIEAHALSAGDLLEIGAMLDRLWGSRPRVLESLEIEDTIARLGLVRLVDDRNGAAAIGWGGAPKSWRHFFSVTLMFAEALNEYEVFFAEAMRIDALRGPERREAADALHRRTSGSRNPIVAQMLPTVAKVLRRDMMAE